MARVESNGANKSQKMNKTGGTKIPLIRQLGFNARRRRALLELIGLDARDRVTAAYLQKHVIVPHVNAIIDEFYLGLASHPEARKIFKQGFKLAHLRATQRDYLLSLGVGFDRTGYFEGRLRVGIAHVRVPVPLSLYQAAYSLLQQLILKHLPAGNGRGAGDPRGLAAFLVKITSLDMCLAIDTYHAARVGALEKSLSTMRDKTAQLHRLAETDRFTGLVDHAKILEILARALAKRGRRPVSVIVVDVDKFKTINDTHGHVAGDKILRGIAARLQSAARRHDVVGRYGGDEFLIVLRDTPLRTARAIAGRLCAHVGNEPFDLDGKRVVITVSLGVASATLTDDKAEALIARADAALYGAKQAGCNRVTVAGARIATGTRSQLMLA